VHTQPEIDPERNPDALGQCTSHNLKKFHECLKEFGALRVSHPAHNSDLTSSDFFHFGTLKTELHDYDIYSRDDLISAI
jgi:hypothetical protein